MKLYQASALGTSYSITVGAGGAAGVDTGGYGTGGVGGSGGIVIQEYTRN